MRARPHQERRLRCGVSRRPPPCADSRRARQVEFADVLVLNKCAAAGAAHADRAAAALAALNPGARLLRADFGRVDPRALLHTRRCALPPACTLRPGRLPPALLHPQVPRVLLSVMTVRNHAGCEAASRAPGLLLTACCNFYTGRAQPGSECITRRPAAWRGAGSRPTARGAGAGSIWAARRSRPAGSRSCWAAARTRPRRRRWGSRRLCSARRGRSSR